MGKAIVKYLHDRGEDPRGMADGVDSPCMETKGCSQNLEKKRGVTLLNHVLKTLERIMDERIRRIVECELVEEQQGFRRSRGTADGIFTLRQLVEKKLEGQENMAVDS